MKKTVIALTLVSALLFSSAVGTLSLNAAENSWTTKAPMPLPIKIKGTDKVKAKAPMTPSMENEASNISRYKILLQALRPGFNNSFSFSSAFFFKTVSDKESGCAD